MSDNLVVFEGSGKSAGADTQKLYDLLKEVIYTASEEGHLSLVSVIGVLEVLKLDLLAEQTYAQQGGD